MPGGDGRGHRQAYHGRTRFEYGDRLSHAAPEEARSEHEREQAARIAARRTVARQAIRRGWQPAETREVLEMLGVVHA